MSRAPRLLAARGRAAACAGLIVVLTHPSAAGADAAACPPAGRWLEDEVHRGQPAQPDTATQAGIDGLAATGANVVSLHALMRDGRTCPVADFSALAKMAGLVAVDALPVECLPAFARTAPLPSLRALDILCGDGTSIDLTQLRPFAGLTTVRLGFGCKHAAAGLAPLAQLVHLERFIDESSGRFDGIEKLTGLTALIVSSESGNLAPLARLKALRALHLTVYTPADLGPLAQLPALEELVIEAGTQVDAAPLANLTALRRLELHGEALDQLPALARLEGLCALDVGDDRGRIDLAPFAKLGKLTTLRVRASGASLAPLARLEALEQLELVSGCDRPTVNLAPLAKLPRLKRISLAGAIRVVTPTWLEQKIQQRLPRHCGGRKPRSP